ncbi:MAG: DUF3109 family protein [Bacteroidota bacterium]
MYFDNMISVSKVMVRKEVLENCFTCDLNKCKGACCTMESEYGAPLKEEEIKIIDNVLPEVLPYLPGLHRQEIEKNGFWEEKDGELLTRSVDNKACVFVYYDGDIAKCAIEKACKDGKISFIKPVSCHLFPIRISNFGGDIVRYEKIDECRDAVVNGAITKITIAEFCREALIRLYGIKWFEKLKEYFRS